VHKLRQLKKPTVILASDRDSGLWIFQYWRDRQTQATLDGKGRREPALPLVSGRHIGEDRPAAVHTTRG
jgi:hypothetical protein